MQERPFGGDGVGIIATADLINRANDRTIKGGGTIVS
jgi:hypothetical protein